jgi:hypothetical protein
MNKMDKKFVEKEIDKKNKLVSGILVIISLTIFVAITIFLCLDTHLYDTASKESSKMFDKTLELKTELQEEFNKYSKEVFEIGEIISKGFVNIKKDISFLNNKRIQDEQKIKELEARIKYLECRVDKGEK